MIVLVLWALGNLIADRDTTGAAISGSFLFVVGVANSIILYRIVKQCRRVCIKVYFIRHRSMYPGSDTRPRFVTCCRR